MNRETEQDWSDRHKFNVFHSQGWRLPFWIAVVIGSGSAKAFLPRSGDIALLSILVVLALGFMFGEFVKRFTNGNTEWTWQQDCVFLGLALGTTIAIAIVMLIVSFAIGNTENLYNRWGSYVLGEAIALSIFSIVCSIRVRKDQSEIKKR